MVPHGEGRRQQIIDMGILDPGPVGSDSRTGPVLTKTLLFLAQRDGDRNLLRAFDKASGDIVHEFELPPGGTPMTYMVNGNQYISIAVRGRQNSRLVTLTLPCPKHNFITQLKARSKSHRHGRAQIVYARLCT